MLSCLIGVVIAAVVVIIVLLILEAIVNAIAPLPANVWYLIRLLFALVVLLYGLHCFLGGGGFEAIHLSCR